MVVEEDVNAQQSPDGSRVEQRRIGGMEQHERVVVEGERSNGSEMPGVVVVMKGWRAGVG